MTKEELEALIAIASQPDNGEKYKDLSSLDSWIIAVGLTPGYERITPLRVYVAYRRWAKYPVNRIDFYVQLKRRFKSRRATKAKDGSADKVYFMNPEPFYTVPKGSEALRQELIDIENEKIAAKDTRITQPVKNPHSIKERKK